MYHEKHRTRWVTQVRGEEEREPSTVPQYAERPEPVVVQQSDAKSNQHPAQPDDAAWNEDNPDHGRQIDDPRNRQDSGHPSDRLGRPRGWPRDF